MKKSIKLLSAAAILISVFFTGCYDPIFYEIRKDVKPEEPTVSGFITSITRYTTTDGREYLALAADGCLKYKDAANESHDSWRTYGVPFASHTYDYYESAHNGQQIIKVLANESYLYLVTATYKDNPSKGTTIVDYISVYGKQITANSNGSWSSDGEWTLIIGQDKSKDYFPLWYYDEYMKSAFAVFQTNTPGKANRKVYIRTGDADLADSSLPALYSTVQYWELTGLSAPTSITVTVSDNGAAKNNACSASVVNGTPYFFNSDAATSNETYSTPATYIYYGKGDELWYMNGTTNQKALDAGSHITCLATTNDSIIIGRGSFTSSAVTGGVVRARLEGGVPGTGLIDFSTNAPFQLSSSYTIYTLLNATPDKNETASALYSSIGFSGTGGASNVSYNSVGLWSFYPARGNWNRE